MINKIAIENPYTYDDINKYITMLGVCLVVLLIVIVIKYFKNKK